MRFLQPFYDLFSSTVTPSERVISLLVASALVLVGTITLRALYITIRLLWFQILGRRHAHQAAVFEVARPNGKRILIVGDSTAFGTGAARPEDSIAGRLAQDFPDTEIINHAVNGAITREVLPQLQRAAGQHFDLVLVFTGGNDIWRFTNLKEMGLKLRELLDEATVLSGHRVIVLFYANFGLSPIFPSFLRNLLERRTERVRQTFVHVCTELGTPCIELYTASTKDTWAWASSNPFAADPKIYFSGDYVHPSSEGYRLWYNRMWREMLARGYSFEET
ncbi:MAG: GDSL-type esterase/lipase family protein [bacterium]|nr:GDSL-type esterase/lipase family protein [bacterium]